MKVALKDSLPFLFSILNDSTTLRQLLAKSNSLQTPYDSTTLRQKKDFLSNNSVGRD